MKKTNRFTRKNQRPTIGLLGNSQQSYPLGTRSELPKGALFFAYFLLGKQKKVRLSQDTRERLFQSEHTYLTNHISQFTNHKTIDLYICKQ